LCIPRLLYSPWQPLEFPSAITPIGQLHQSPPWPIPGDLGRGPSHQSHVLEHRDTYGQAQVCCKVHQGSSVDRPCQSSFSWIQLCFVRNPLPQSIRLRLSVLVRSWDGSESQLCPKQPQLEEKTTSDRSITRIRPLPFFCFFWRSLPNRDCPQRNPCLGDGVHALIPVLRKGGGCFPLYHTPILTVLLSYKVKTCASTISFHAPYGAPGCS